MKKLIIYSLILVSFLIACEDIYTPEIDSVDNVIVVDARIESGKSENYIRLYESHGYSTKKESYSGITEASVFIISNNGDEIELPQTSEGVFLLNNFLNPEYSYKLKIDYREETFESAFEEVPALPEIDTVYGIAETKIIKQDGNNDVNDYREKPGVQLYADITQENELPYFKFTSRKILQYTYPVEVPTFGGVMEVTMYGWYSYYPHDYYNIAAPPEYSVSTDVLKHPLYFMELKATRDTGQFFGGWILILYQHALSKNAYSYYKDLNSQLIAEGRLFDPVYVQARNNLKCTSDPNLLILGNFEISTVGETRYFVRFQSEKEGYIVKPIPYFYQIPESGEQLDLMPDFWENKSKSYPNE